METLLCRKIECTDKAFYSVVLMSEDETYDVELCGDHAMNAREFDPDFKSIKSLRRG